MPTNKKYESKTPQGEASYRKFRGVKHKSQAIIKGSPLQGSKELSIAASKDTLKHLEKANYYISHNWHIIIWCCFYPTTEINSNTCRREVNSNTCRRERNTSVHHISHLDGRSTHRTMSQA
jgi:hypothetical protein